RAASRPPSATGCSPFELIFDVVDEDQLRDRVVQQSEDEALLPSLPIVSFEADERRVDAHGRAALP
ncbi:hypothetical protein PFISCL1PPCAC_11610, partial [Pristionchus fissidentatus]